MAERLTAQDASFLFAEEPGQPMAVGGLALLDTSTREAGAIRPAELRRRIGSRLARLPRFRQRLANAPFGLMRPQWVEDPDFDLDRHIAVHRLPAGSGWEDLLELVGEIHSTPLDLHRPLWHVNLVEGLPQARQALITRTHHSIADGIAGLDVAEAIFDRLPRRPRQRPVQHFLGPDGDRVHPAVRLLQAAEGVGRYVAGGPLAGDCPFNGHVGPRRAVATAKISLEDCLEVKEVLGGTVDDVLLATVALGLGCYLHRHWTAISGKSLRAMVPVSTRGSSRGPGNSVSAVFIDLPLDQSPVACLHEIAASKALHRSWHEALGLRAILDAGGLVPAPLEAALVRLATHSRYANLIISNIPGPKEPLNLLGARVLETYPLMPLTRSVGLSVAALTLGGVIGLGVTADPNLVPDVGGLAGDLSEGFASLQHAAQTTG